MASVEELVDQIKFLQQQNEIRAQEAQALQKEVQTVTKGYQEEINNLKKEKGIEHVDTLDCFFELFDNCIQLYRLNKMSNYLATIVPHCRTRTDRFKLKAIQALGFVRWKQNEFQAALGTFFERF